MTVMQAVALGGGVTLRGTEKGIQIRRRDVGGKVETLNAGMQDRVMQDDVIYVRESVF
jgi:polysaccharide export outer membrane protein